MTRDVVVIGNAGQVASDGLQTAGSTDILRLDDAAGAVFDDESHCWEVRSAAGQTVRARVVVDASGSLLAPWIPEFAGRNEFRGAAFHAAHWDPAFDTAGKRVAVVGTDSTAGHHLERLAASAASVTVFAHAPRRLVPELPLPATRVKRWLTRRARRTPPAVAGSAIAAITATGIRTADGAEHPADAIVYGTGFGIADRAAGAALVGTGGVTLGEALDDGTEPFLGVALHGFPNYFWLTGPDAAAQARYVARCVALMTESGATRIEVRRSSQQVFNERAHLAAATPFRVRSAFDLSSAATGGTQTYDGEATLTVAGISHPVRVRLTGRLDPIDGHYHWQGTVFSSPAQPLPDEVLRQARAATLTVGERTAPARITEQTPWGTHSVAGVGAPPYALSGL